VSVDVRSAQAEEERARRDGTRVVCEIGDVDAGVAHDGGGVERDGDVA
jgi:hypothetical protein